MKKKLIIYGSICIFILGFCLLLFFNKQGADSGEETAPVPDAAAIGTDVEIEIKSTNSTDILESSENDTVTEPVETIETESPEVPETENDIDKQEEKEFPDDIFYWGAEEYFYLLEGEWVAIEYVGEIRESHFDEVWEEEYQEEHQKYTDEVIEKYLGSEYRVEMDNLLSFAPYSDLDLILEDGDELFNITRFIPGEFITITPPYIALSARLADKDEEYWFIIDADGTVLIEIEYRFFRLEKK